ncbi:MAG: nicotinate phosphoribosyltransferase, partial [Roseomonas sp.]|nr:nicotinate phosphoribosyltransferase [Roseomonas sp.]
MNTQSSRGGETPSAAADVADQVITARADSYFNRTKAVVQRFGDAEVTYAVF